VFVLEITVRKAFSTGTAVGPPRSSYTNSRAELRTGQATGSDEHLVMTNWDILQRLRTGDAEQRSGMLGEIVTV